MSRLTQHMPAVAGYRERLATLAIEPADPNAPMVMILSPERLAALFFGAPQAIPAALVA